MNESINERLKDAFSTVDFNTYRPAAVYGDIIEEIIEKTLPSYDVDSTYLEFVDFRPKPTPKRRKQETKQPEEELSVGDTSSLDAFMGEFTVSKRVGEV